MPRLGKSVVFSLFSLLTGCAAWETPQRPPELKLPAPGVSADSILFETAFIRWPSESEDHDESADASTKLWQVADEQFLPPERKQHLIANGLRAGILNDPLPESIRLALERSRDPLAVITNQDATPGMEVLTRRERQQCSSGSTIDIEVLLQSEESRVVLFHDHGRIRADHFDQPRGYFRFHPSSLGDGRVRGELRPVIEFGEQRQRRIGGQGAWRFDNQRERSTYDSLTIPVTLAPRQTLVVTTVPEPVGLGATFFANRFEASPDRLLFLIRIAETHRDELFGHAPQRDALVTPLE